MWSTAEVRAAREGVEGSVVYTPQEEETRRRITSTEVDGYRSGLTPRNLLKFLAKGQQSTDPIRSEGQTPSGIRLSQYLTAPATTESGRVRLVETLDLCRGWNVSETLSTRWKIAHAREY